MAERLKNTCSWSSSRESTFFECKKKYWYTYYGAWEGWPLFYKDARAHVDPLAHYLYRLKNMQPLVMFTGSIVHKAIETCLKTFSQSGHLPPAQWLIKEGLSLLHKGLDDSKNKAWMISPKKHANLLEDYYSKEKPPLEALEQKVTCCLTNWHSSSIASMITQPAASFGDVEKLMQFPIEKDYDCIVVFDFFMHWNKGKPGEKLIIFDWKTGTENSRIAKQMAAYALAATHVLKTPFESIILCPFYLSEGPCSYKKMGHGQKEPLGEHELEETKQAILSTLTQMKKLHSEPLLPDPLHFAYTSERRTCSMCPFQELCHKAQYQEKNRQELLELTRS